MTDPKMTRALLIRHGINDFVKTRKLAGWTPEVHLNDHGRAQAEALAERLAGEQIAAIYSSPLERTRETAEPIAARHQLPLVIVEGLGETRIGEWTGLPIEDVEKTDLWRQIQLYPSGARFPGGETMAELQTRMVAALEGLRAAHPEQTFVVVSHSDPIKSAVAHYAGLHLDLFQRLVISPASITEIGFTSFGPRLLRCNDCAHNPPDEEAKT